MDAFKAAEEDVTRMIHDPWSEQHECCVSSGNKTGNCSAIWSFPFIFIGWGLHLLFFSGGGRPCLPLVVKDSPSHNSTYTVNDPKAQHRHSGWIQEPVSGGGTVRSPAPPPQSAGYPVQTCLKYRFRMRWRGWKKSRKGRTVNLRSPCCYRTTHQLAAASGLEDSLQFITQIQVLLDSSPVALLSAPACGRRPRRVK